MSVRKCKNCQYWYDVGDENGFPTDVPICNITGEKTQAEQICNAIPLDVVVVQPNKPAHKAEILYDPIVMEQCVGGYLEIIPFDSDKSWLVCCENGKVERMPENRIVDGEMIYGTFFICGKSQNEDSAFVSLPTAEIEQYIQYFNSLQDQQKPKQET